MSNEPAHVIAEAVAEVQATLFDHYQRGKGTSAQVLAKINVIMSERTLIRAMYDAGYIPAMIQPAPPSLYRRDLNDGRRRTGAI
jgi:hypothetical protein